MIPTKPLRVFAGAPGRVLILWGQSGPDAAKPRQDRARGVFRRARSLG